MKKILVVDEPGFARICGALLSLKGFVCETPEGNGAAMFEAGEYSLVITSFPYGAELVGRMGGSEVPVLVLADCLSRDLLETVRSVRRSSCLIKPLDFEQFPLVVRRILVDSDHHARGYEIS